MLGVEDNQDQIVNLLREIRDAQQGGTLPGQSSGSSSSVRREEHTTLRVHDTAGEFTPPQNSLNLVNQRWEDDRLADIDLADLEPGEDQVVARMESNENDLYVTAKAVSTTKHTHDYDGDGATESAVNYKWEYKTHGGDGWTELPGMDSTLPLGDYLGQPVEIIPGKSIGPMAGFRVTFENVTDGENSPTTIPAGEIGAQIAGTIIRTEG
jgi:hypothetical protein